MRIADSDANQLRASNGNWLVEDGFSNPAKLGRVADDQNSIRGPIVCVHLIDMSFDLILAKIARIVGQT